jgi:hypothetical protein
MITVRQSKAATHIDDRDHLAPQIQYPDHMLRQVGNSGDRLNTDNLDDMADFKALTFAGQIEG